MCFACVQVLRLTTFIYGLQNLLLFGLLKPLEVASSIMLAAAYL